MRIVLTYLPKKNLRQWKTICGNAQRHAWRKVFPVLSWTGILLFSFFLFGCMQQQHAVTPTPSVTPAPPITTTPISTPTVMPTVSPMNDANNASMRAHASCGPEEVLRSGECVNLDRYMPCGPGGTLAYYEECDHPEQYSITTVAKSRNITACLRLSTKNLRISCIAYIAAAKKNVSVCNEATEDAAGCVERYDDVVSIKKLPDWMTSDKMLLEQREVDSIQTVGMLPPIRGNFDEYPVGKWNKEVDRYNEAVEEMNESACAGMQLVKELCYAHIGKLKRNRGLCDTPNITSHDCYEFFDNINFTVNNGVNYCETAGDCALKEDYGIIKKNESCGVQELVCQSSKCTWNCLGN